MRFWTLVPAVLCLAFSPVLGEGAAGARLYTNADLVKNETPSGPSPEATTFDATGWEFVRDFIDREYVRIDAASDVIERRRADRETEPRSTDYAIPYTGLYYGYANFGHCTPRPPRYEAGPFGRAGHLKGSDAFPDRARKRARPNPPASSRLNVQ